MRLHRSAYCLIIALAAVALVTPARANVMIIIDKSTQKMSVTVDGEERYVWPVSTGREGYDTPSGEFQPFRMERDHFSREWDDAPMPNSIFFTQIGHAIHGTFEARNLGRPVSHGCVRLSTQNAATLYALVKDEGVFNTRVRLVGAAPKIPDQPVARRSNGDRSAARTRDSDRDASRDRDNSDGRTYVRNYSTDDDDDAAANQPSASARQRWRDTRSYYNYRDPYYQRRYYYGRGLFSSPFGW